MLQALLLLALTSLPQGAGWTVGQPVPDLRLPTIDGAETMDLRQFRGVKLLLIEFASW